MRYWKTVPPLLLPVALSLWMGTPGCSNHLGVLPAPPATNTPVSVNTATLTQTPTASLTTTASPTATLSVTLSFTSSATHTPTLTATNSPIPSQTATPTPCLTNTATLMISSTATNTTTLTPTCTPTNSITSTTTNSPTNTPTLTGTWTTFTSTTTLTPNATATACSAGGIVMGNNVISAGGGSGTAQLWLGRYQATYNTTVVSLTAGMFPSSIFQLAVYADDGTGASPTTLLAQADPQTATSVGFYTGAISPSLNITAGSNYWMGAAVQSGTLYFGGPAGTYANGFPVSPGGLPVSFSSLSRSVTTSPYYNFAIYVNGCPFYTLTPTLTNTFTLTRTPTLSPTITSTPTSTFTPNPTATNCAVFSYLGNKGQTGSNDLGNNTLLLSPYQATYSTTLYALTGYLGSGSTYSLVFYDDDGTGTQPTTLLGQTSSFYVNYGYQWFTNPLINPVSITAGHYYWIGAAMGAGYLGETVGTAYAAQFGIDINNPPSSFTGIYYPSGGFSWSVYACGCPGPALTPTPTGTYATPTNTITSTVTNTPTVTPTPT